MNLLFTVEKAKKKMTLPKVRLKNIKDIIKGNAK